MQGNFVFLRTCIYCACFQLFTVISAQNVDTVKMIQLQDVEVVGQTRSPVSKQVAPLQIIDNKSISRLGLNNLSDAVKTFSGVTVKDYGGMGGLKTVSIRGLGAHHMAVGYDGIAVSDAQSGQIDVSRFTLDNVEYVSLAIGQTDEIFLPAKLFASAGVLNIKPKVLFFEHKPYLISLKLKRGSFGFVNPSVSCSRKINKRWNASVNADYVTAKSDYPYLLKNGNITTKEQRINSDVESKRIEADVRGQISDNTLINTKIYTFHSERGLPGSVHFYDKTASERLWNDVSFVQTHYKSIINRQFSLQAALKYNYAYSKYLDISDKYAAGKQEDKNTQHEYYGTMGGLYTLNNSLSASLTTDYAITTLKNNFMNSPKYQRNTSLTVLAAKYRKSAFTLTGSILYSLYRDKNDQSSQENLSSLSPALAFSWQPFPVNPLRIRASFKNIFRMPTFTDLYYLRIGNTNLKPEDSQQFNAGITWEGNVFEIKNVSLTADAYYNKVDNRIVAIPTLYIWKMMNMGTVDIKGFDLNLSCEIPFGDKANIHFSGNYSYQYAVDITDPQAKNYEHQIPYTPRHSGGGSVAFENRFINISYLFMAVGQRFSLPQNIAANKIGAYSEHSVSINKTVKISGLSLRLQGEIINLLDAQYDVIQYYPMPGRSWKISFTLDI